ncbi:MAG TPA: T9SS type A sorting domain-containing protein [Flavobacterium sp.]|nr:T9SS type A sorting domain-containing protein [Flavobacterium sp.]
MKKFLLSFLFSFLTTSSILSQCYTAYRDAVWDSSSAIVRKDDGTLWIKAYTNYYGMFANGTNVTPPIAWYQLGTDNNWSDEFSLYYHALAIKNDGTLWSWGNNDYGQCGLGYSFPTLTATVNTPTQVGTDTNWVKVAVGWYHSLGLKSDGTLWSWGANSGGSLGINSTVISVSTPTQVGTQNNWKDIYADWDVSFAIKTDNTLWSWGQDGNLLHPQSRIPLQASNYTWKKISLSSYRRGLGIKMDGTLWYWGSGFGVLNIATTTITPDVYGLKQIGTDNDWQDISQGSSHIMALKSNGTMWSAGLNESYDLGDGTNINRSNLVQIMPQMNWSSIEAGNHLGSAINTEGELYTWGGSAITNPTQVGVNCLLSVKEENSINQIIIYPNPTTGIVYFETETFGSYNYKISNTIGQVVKKFNNSNNYTTQIDISDLVEGVYFVTIENGVNTITKKIIKQ